MLRRLLTLAAFLLPIGSVFAQEKKDDGIVGDYRVVSVTKAGIPLDKAALEEMKGVTIRDGKLIAKLPGEERVAAIRVDASANPKTLDMVPMLPDTADGKKATEIVLPGIYALEGVQLTISLAASATTARPTTLTSTAENKQFVLVLTRGPATTVTPKTPEASPPKTTKRSDK